MYGFCLHCPPNNPKRIESLLVPPEDAVKDLAAKFLRHLSKVHPDVVQLVQANLKSIFLTIDGYSTLQNLDIPEEDVNKPLIDYQEKLANVIITNLFGPDEEDEEDKDEKEDLDKDEDEIEGKEQLPEPEPEPPPILPEPV